jgi:hypothetical protein
MIDHIRIPEWLQHTAKWDYRDSQWFKANPDRNYRLRTMFDFELQIPGAPDGVWVTVVKQVAPGHRRRTFLLFGANELPGDNEVTAQYYWHLTTAEGVRGRGLLPAAA